MTNKRQHILLLRKLLTAVTLLLYIYTIQGFTIDMETKRRPKHLLSFLMIEMIVMFNRHMRFSILIT